MICTLGGVFAGDAGLAEFQPETYASESQSGPAVAMLHTGTSGTERETTHLETFLGGVTEPEI